jgi:hypothetical protein
MPVFAPWERFAEFSHDIVYRNALPHFALDPLICFSQPLPMSSLRAGLRQKCPDHLKSDLLSIQLLDDCAGMTGACVLEMALSQKPCRGAE